MTITPGQWLSKQIEVPTYTRIFEKYNEGHNSVLDVCKYMKQVALRTATLADGYATQHNGWFWGKFWKQDPVYYTCKRSIVNLSEAHRQFSSLFTKLEGGTEKIKIQGGEVELPDYLLGVDGIENVSEELKQKFNRRLEKIKNCITPLQGHVDKVHKSYNSNWRFVRPVLISYFVYLVFFSK